MTPNNFDVLRGVWLQGPSGPYPRPVARHTVDLMTVVGEELILMGYVSGNGATAGNNWPVYTSVNTQTVGRIAHFNLRTRQWSYSPTEVGAMEYPATEYDPPSGKVIVLGPRALFVYDPVTKKKVAAINFLAYPGAYQVQDEEGTRLQSGLLSYNQNLVYYPPTGRHYYIVSRETSISSTGSVFEVLLNREDFSKSIVRRIADAPLVANTKFAYDSKNRLIGGGLADGVFHAFDPRIRTWAAKKVNGPDSTAFMAMDYDPVSNAYIILTPQRETWAYRWQ